MIAEIAEKTVFNSLNSFGKAFRRAKGISPSESRKTAKLEEVG
jgi:transcriptional regulator GlxA family with amidase domain